jgi:hypothetical protein
MYLLSLPTSIPLIHSFIFCSRFLPTFKKKNVKRKKKVVIVKKEKAVFPPEQTPRKVHNSS